MLFGKPFRKVSKGSLVNSVNNKDCCVEIEFSVNNKQYRVVRGIKPNIFEIYCDGLCLNQDSTTRDYQEHLEKIVKTYKSFVQVVILGSASFVPFMQLSAADRRTVIEDLLDIQVFSVMANILKQKMQENKQAIELNRAEITHLNDKTIFLNRTISSLQQNNETKIKNWCDEIDSLNVEITHLESELSAIQIEKEGLSWNAGDWDKLKKKHAIMISLHASVKAKLDNVVKELSFLGNHDDCPTCKQSLDINHKQNRQLELESEKNKFKTALDDMDKKISDIVNRVEESENVAKKITSIEYQEQIKSQHIKNRKDTVKSVEKLISDTSNSDVVLADNQKELSDVEAAIKVAEGERSKLHDDKSYNDAATLLLKDGGIKTKIIKQYLPVINNQINKYLLQMGFMVNFSIDENFNESIKSRYRDDFSYESFSQGEKFRIDLALLLTWRAIARQKNSVSTNLLILDEIFDGSLDDDGTEEFLKIMWTLVNDTNIFVISHKQDQLLDKFSRVYKFQRQKNFSVVGTA